MVSAMVDESVESWDIDLAYPLAVSSADVTVD